MDNTRMQLAQALTTPLGTAPLGGLKRTVTPQSTAGVLAARQAYNAHVIDAQTNGQPAMSFEQFLQTQGR